MHQNHWKKPHASLQEELGANPTKIIIMGDMNTRMGNDGI